MIWFVLTTIAVAIGIIVFYNLRHPREVSPPVLCRDCKHSRAKGEKILPYGCVWCTKHGRGMNEIDFCEEGERK